MQTIVSYNGKPFDVLPYSDVEFSWYTSLKIITPHGDATLEEKQRLFIQSVLYLNKYITEVLNNSVSERNFEDVFTNWETPYRRGPRIPVETRTHLLNLLKLHCGVCTEQQFFYPPAHRQFKRKIRYAIQCSRNEVKRLSSQKSKEFLNEKLRQRDLQNEKIDLRRLEAAEALNNSIYNKSAVSIIVKGMEYDIIKIISNEYGIDRIKVAELLADYYKFLSLDFKRKHGKLAEAESIIRNLNQWEKRKSDLAFKARYQKAWMAFDFYFLDE